MARPTRIGLVFSYSLAYCRGILRGIRRYAQVRPDWIFTPIDPDARGLRILRDLRPAGIIAHVYTRELAATLRALRKPLVNVCGVLPDLPVPRVGLDDAAIGAAAAEHLLDRGLRSFAFVGHTNHGYSIAREAAFTRRIAAAGYTVRSHLEPGARFAPRGRLWSLDKSLRDWVGALPRPVGIFACNDVWGAQISETCRQAGLTVPEEVAIVGVDNDDLLCDLARPSLSSVAVPAEPVGFQAARLLDRIMAGKKPPSEPILLPPTGVVVRHSSDVLAIADADVAEAVRTIRMLAHKPLTIEDVLAAVPVSRRSLERRFRKSLNRGIWEEIRRVHMDRARHLLATTDLPISEVAATSGFSECKHLSVVFRQEAGMTPTTYRRRARGDVRTR
jgi:LacI family transcriptional regulator